jgi:hypothetical protein
MKLWIRSQDKERLFKADKLGIQEAKDVFLVVLYTDYDEWWKLGTYKTRERALEVLNEIQSILNLKNMYKYDRELVLKSWEIVDEEQVKIVRQQMSVYEMPKD